ncbi:hypothetical protein [Bradyrhizobium diversitatis]|uniref:hypothetical protein n=1 Tax=Bradyrhizobium diversitatis TaxID=2755406 RepID=UPI001FE44986|nr:hypothetical protein [Bradyrhizobium diversitatis]
MDEVAEGLDRINVGTTTAIPQICLLAPAPRPLRSSNGIFEMEDQGVPQDPQIRLQS